MNCIGCGAGPINPAAFAIMAESDFNTLEIIPTKLGPKKFHAGPVCAKCFTDPAHRKVALKAHFALPNQVDVMLDRAGSSGQIG